MSMSAVRVPVPDGSLSDLVLHLKKDADDKDVNEALRAAAAGRLKGILEYSEEELVSSDIIGNPHSGIVDALSTKSMMGKVVKVMIWYDNEYGYAARTLELAQYMAGK